jgi:CheY-like chemotaxis protein
LNGQKKILIIEDDEGIRDSIRDILELKNYQVECASNGEEGIQALRRGRLPDVILLDLMMPIKDGFQFRLEQQQDPVLGSIPVVVLTADAHILQNKEKLNCEMYITKPFDLETILQAIEQSWTAGGSMTKGH